MPKEQLQQEKRTIKLFSKQYDAYHFPTQFGAAVAGVQSGKTFTGVHWTGKKICKFPEGTGIIAAPTYKILQQATLKKFFEIFPELRIYYKEQKGEIALPTGGTVYIRSMDNPFGAEGITADWWWLDEGGLCSVNAWVVFRSRVSRTGGQGLITTTPYNMGWLYRDFFIPWKEKTDKALSFYTWASIENPYFPKEFYEAEKKRLRPEEFARRYGGKFTKMVGLVYDIPDDLIIEPFAGEILMVKADARIIGIDWGYRNPAAVGVYYYYDKAWYVVDEWKRAERTTEEIIQVAKNKMAEHRVTKIYPDPVEPGRIEECRRAGLPMMETNKDIKGGASHIQQLIREKRFFVYKTCEEHINEASMYHYPESEEGKPFKDEPEKFNDHLMDAMRYAIYSYKPVDLKVLQPTASIKPYYVELGF